jgi:hypothetical protein
MLLGTVLAGCVRHRSPSEQAVWEATRTARDKAEQTRVHLETILRSDRADDPQAALELGRTELKETVASDGWSSLLGSGLGADGSTQFDLALVGGSETGGGLTYAAATVLLCARLTATPGPAARATLAESPIASDGRED